MSNMADAKATCPKCGSNNIDHPRSYVPQGASMKFSHCSAMCMDCKHEERFEAIDAAFRAWKGQP